MKRQEHLLVCAMEECNEVAQRISKALRFGLEEVQPGQSLTNHERIRQEFTDLVAVLDMIDPILTDVDAPGEMDKKQAKVEKYLRYAEECGTVAAGAAGGPTP